MLTLRDLVFSGIGAFVIYLVKRLVENRAERESVALDHRKYELIERYLEIKNRCEPQGTYVEPPASIASLIASSPTPAQWYETVVAIAGLHLRAHHTGCMYMEAISAKHSEYSEGLRLFRNEYVKWYSQAKEKLPVIFERMHPLESKIWHAYYYRITEPTQLNIDGFFASLNEFEEAIESGKLVLASN